MFQMLKGCYIQRKKKISLFELIILLFKYNISKLDIHYSKQN